MNAIKELYSDKKYCFTELQRVRQMFGDKNTTQKVYEAMMKGLFFMLLHCPEEIEDIVRCTIEEATTRELYYVMHIWPKAKLKTEQLGCSV